MKINESGPRREAEILWDTRTRVKPLIARKNVV